MAQPKKPRLTEQVASLTEQLHTVDARLQQVETTQTPLHQGPLIDFRRPAPQAFDGASLTSALVYYERGMRRSVAVYYIIFGALYLRTAFAILEPARSLFALPLPLRIVVALVAALVGIGNLSCIAWPTVRYQLVMLVPTIGTALLVMILSLVARDHLPASMLIATAIFWGAIVWIHLAFGSAIRARAGLRDFTQRLLAASVARDQDHPPGSGGTP